MEWVGPWKETFHTPHLVKLAVPHNYPLIDFEFFSMKSIGLHPPNFHPQERIIWEYNDVHYVKPSLYFPLVTERNCLAGWVVKGNSLKKPVELLERRERERESMLSFTWAGWDWQALSLQLTHNALETHRLSRNIRYFASRTVDNRVVAKQQLMGKSLHCNALIPPAMLWNLCRDKYRFTSKLLQSRNSAMKSQKCRLSWRRGFHKGQALLLGLWHDHVASAWGALGNLLW